MRARGVVLLLLTAGVFAARAGATVEMQVAAKKLGYPVGNCLYCHARSHSVAVMKEKAKSLGVSEGNCLACHGANVPAKLNDRGRWLVAEKAKRAARVCDMAWLREYKEPAPATGKPAAKAPPSH